MSNFAEIDQVTKEVLRVIVAEQDFIDSEVLGDPNNWIQTSYNTRGGIHYGKDNLPDAGIPLRKNYAGIGFKYDEARDAFIPPKPFESWKIDETPAQWKAPKAYPKDGNNHKWDEDSLSWIKQ